MSSFNVTFVARTPPAGLNSNEGRPPVPSLIRIDATSNRSDSAGTDCAVRIPASPPVSTKMPNRSTRSLLATRYHAYPAGLRNGARRQRIAGDLRLLLLMALAASGRGTGALRPAHVSHFTARLLQQRLDGIAKEA